jgi:DNA-binding NarL/FixJ family response regulator
MKQALELLPDIIIMDLSMPGLNGIERPADIVGVRVKVIALSIRQPLCAQHDQAGASGYLLRTAPWKNW